MMTPCEETRKRMMTPSDREIHSSCSIEQKRERWLERWRLCGRTLLIESGDGGE